MVLARPIQEVSRARKVARASGVVESGMTRSTLSKMEATAMVEEEGVGEGVLEGVAPTVMDPVGVALLVGELVAEGQLDMDSEG